MSNVTNTGCMMFLFRVYGRTGKGTSEVQNRKTRHISGFPMSLQTLLNCYLVPKAGLEPARPEGIGF